MITINVFLHFDSQRKEDYLKTINQFVQKSKKEEGCIYYEHFINLTCSDKFIIVENWENEASIDLHKESIHFKNFIETVDQFFVEKLQIIVSS